VPIIGVGVRYTKWLAAIRNVWYARESIREGYAKASCSRLSWQHGTQLTVDTQHGDFAFQIPTMTRMDIFICDRQMTREYYTVDDDHLSFRAVMSEVCRGTRSHSLHRSTSNCYQGIPIRASSSRAATRCPQDTQLGHCKGLELAENQGKQTRGPVLQVLLGRVCPWVPGRNATISTEPELGHLPIVPRYCPGRRLWMERCAVFPTCHQGHCTTYNILFVR
jgi:hypothetical protein